MILLNVFIGLYVIFIVPQISLLYKFKKLPYSLILSIGLILSFTVSWVVFIVLFHFSINSYYSIIVIWVVFFYSFYLVYKGDIFSNKFIIYFWSLTYILLMPLLVHIGENFIELDAVVSWNRWATELYGNQYNPINAAYPILFPALWSLIYKIQGTADIWWAAKITLFVMPLLISLYKENRDSTFLFLVLLIYPYFLWKPTISGYMDMPVMLFGLVSLIFLYTANINKKSLYYTYYIGTAFLFAGLSFIVKQAGVVFIIFSVVYTLFNISFVKNKKLYLVYL